MNALMIARRILAITLVDALSAEAQESDPEAGLAKQMVNPVEIRINDQVSDYSRNLPPNQDNKLPS